MSYVRSQNNELNLSKKSGSYGKEHRYFIILGSERQRPISFQMFGVSVTRFQSSLPITNTTYKFTYNMFQSITMYLIMGDPRSEQYSRMLQDRELNKVILLVEVLKYLDVRIHKAFGAHSADILTAHF